MQPKLTTQNPRIIAGTAKNKRLLVPEVSRPVTDRIKQSIFDILAERVVDAQVLDLFAGSGSFGLEALSRGAKFTTFIEADYHAHKLLKQNVEALGFTDKAKVSDKQAHKFMWNTESNFDIIFVDPPFPNATEFAYYLLAERLKPQGVAVVRIPVKLTPSDINLGDKLQILYQAKYGDSLVLFLGI